MEFLMIDDHPLKRMPFMSRLELLRKWLRDLSVEIEKAKQNQNFYLRVELEYLREELKRIWDKK